MGRNPGFGRWRCDDDPADLCGRVDTDSLMSRGWSCWPWDLRMKDEAPAPCEVRVGPYVLRGVVFPRRASAVQKVRRLARAAFAAHGNLGDPDAYPVPAELRRRGELVPLYRYFLARLLCGLARAE